MDIIVVATVVIKIKCRGSHTASNSLDFPLSPLFSVNLAGWENLPNLTQLVPAPLEIELKSREHGVWPGLSGSTDTCICPCSSLPQGLQRARGPSSDLNLRAEMLTMLKGPSLWFPHWRVSQAPYLLTNKLISYFPYFFLFVCVCVASPQSMWGLGSLTGNWTWVPYSRGEES